MSDVIDAGVQPATETAAPIVTEASPSLPITPSVVNDDSDLMAIWEKNHQPRADDGKFASPKPAVTEPAVEATAPPATETAGQPETAKIEPAQPAIDPPHSWSAEHKAKWATVPPDVQEYVLKRDTEAQQAISRLGSEKQTFEAKVKQYEPLEQLIASNRDDFARRGVSPAQGISVLLDAQRSLDANPAAALVQIGLSYGIDLRPAFQGQQIQQHQHDPQVAQLKQQIQKLEAMVSDTTSKVTEREQAEINTQRTQILKVVEDFSKDKPDWKDVETDVFDMVKVIKDRDPTKAPDQILKEAYDKARWANPEVRTRIQTDQQRETEEKRQAEAKAKAEAARKAASVNVKSSPSSASPKTMDDTLREVAIRAYGRAS
jgi:hypothetical protein